jgi:hypothetical protein
MNLVPRWWRAMCVLLMVEVAPSCRDFRSGPVFTTAGQGGDSSAPGAGGTAATMAMGGTEPGEAGGGPVMWADAATVSRGDGRLDLFWITASGSVAFRPFDRVWYETTTLTSPRGVSFTAVAATVHEGRLDVLASGPDHQLYHARSSGGEPIVQWGVWNILVGADPSGHPDSIAIVSVLDVLHAFWLGVDGNIGHAWGSNDLSDAIETGATPTLKVLQPLVRARTLSALASRGLRIDIVLDGSSSHPLQHHWFDATAGAWGSEPDWHRRALACSQDADSLAPFLSRPTNFALLGTGNDSFEVYALDPGTKPTTSAWRSSYAIPTENWAGSDDVVLFEEVPLVTNPPERLVDAILLDGTYRVLSGVDEGIEAPWLEWL